MKSYILPLLKITGLNYNIYMTKDMAKYTMDYARHNLIWIKTLAEPIKLTKVTENGLHNVQILTEGTLGNLNDSFSLLLKLLI